MSGGLPNTIANYPGRGVASRRQDSRIDYVENDTARLLFRRRPLTPNAGRSGLRNIVIALVVFVSPQGVAEAIQEQSVFRDMRLVLSLYDDAKRPIREMDAPKVGQTFTIYMYVPEASGMRTTGFEIEFGFLSTLRMYQFMVILNGEAYDGSALYADEQYATVTALLLGKPAIPASGYIGSVTFKILKDLPEGDRWILVQHASMGDPETNQRDVLDVVGAYLILTGAPRYIAASIPGDLDLDGDVDFSDFLIFSSNFGRRGDPPTVPEPETVYVTVTDTVYISGSANEHPKSGASLLGFWSFGFGIGSAEAIRLDFVFGKIISDEDSDVIVALGVAHDGTIATLARGITSKKHLLLFKTHEGFETDTRGVIHGEIIFEYSGQGVLLNYGDSGKPVCFLRVWNKETETYSGGAAQCLERSGKGWLRESDGGKFVNLLPNTWEDNEDIEFLKGWTEEQLQQAIGSEQRPVHYAQ